MAKDRTRKRTGLGLVVWPMLGLVGLLVALALIREPAPSTRDEPDPRPSTYLSEQEIQAAARMVEQMRFQAPNAYGQMPDGGEPGDDRHPQDPTSIEELEGYQDTVDRMLGRGAP